MDLAKGGALNGDGLGDDGVDVEGRGAELEVDGVKDGLECGGVEEVGDALGRAVALEKVARKGALGLLGERLFGRDKQPTGKRYLLADVRI